MGRWTSSHCDANNDLVADAPDDPSELVNPDTLVFAYTPVEDWAVIREIQQANGVKYTPENLQKE